VSVFPLGGPSVFAGSSGSAVSAGLQITKVVRSSTLTVTETEAAVSWASATIDDAGAFSTGAATRLTVPASYTKARLVANAVWNTIDDRFRFIRIRKGGTTYLAGDYRTTYQEAGMHCDTGWLTVAGADYFEMMVMAEISPNNGTLQNSTIYGGSFFQIELMA
jgi:hypothetical protein